MSLWITVLASFAVAFVLAFGVVSLMIQSALANEEKKKEEEQRLEAVRQQEIRDKKQSYAYDGNSWQEIEGAKNKMVKEHTQRPQKRSEQPLRSSTISSQNSSYTPSSYDYSGSSYSSSSSDCSSSSSSSSSSSGGGSCD